MGLYDQETDFEDLKSDIVAAVSMCSSSNDEPETSILEETRTLNNEIRQGGLTTGYTKLDNHISCIYPSDFWVISARSGEGKSMFIGPMMMHQAESGCPVGVIHLEMERMEYVWRMVGSKLKMDSNEVRKKADSDPVVIAEIERVQSLPIIYANNLVMNTLNIARWAKKAVREHGIKVLYIDHGLLIEPEYDDEVKATKKSANDLKKLKKELGIPVVLLWQFNKGAEQTFENEEGKQEYVPPKRGHLNSSGAVAQAATRILLLSLKRGTSPEFKLTEELKKREDKPLKLKVNVDKNRFGAEPLLTMDMYPKWGYIDGSRVSDEIVEELSK
jgi:replicative DNA helicase